MSFKKLLGFLLVPSLVACAHKEVSEQPVVVAEAVAKQTIRKKERKTFDVLGNTEGENEIDYQQYLDVIPFSMDEKYVVKGKTYNTKIDVDYKEVGLASWYGGKFHGKATASGVKFDKAMFTAAHRTLPIPSVARVINLKNHRSALVVINDRGPFSADERRIIDLSKKAAEHLGILTKGIEKVKVEYLFEESKALIGKLPKAHQEKALVAYQQALTRQMAEARQSLKTQ